ncbi:MAG: type IV pilus modification PilV family protein [Burkholderiaceae bacterium]
MKRLKATEAGGFVLIEALVSIAIFSFALIGLVGLQSASITAATDAKYRSDASYLSTQIIGLLWSDRANIATYNHRNTGTPCSPGGAATLNPAVLNWLAEVGTTLPGAVSSVQTLAVVTAPNNTSTVTVVVCWKRAQDAGYHQQVTVAQINTN